MEAVLTMELPGFILVRLSSKRDDSGVMAVREEPARMTRQAGLV
jgi:hypothetical protein